jgi:opacity protein-like surface antigen
MKTLKILPFAAALLLGASSAAVAQSRIGSGGVETPGSEALSTDAFGQDMTGVGANSATKDRGAPGSGLTGTIADPDTSGLGPAGLDILDPPSIITPPNSGGTR